MPKNTVLGEDAGIYQKDRPVQEKEKLKGLPLRKKIGYIKDYYLKAFLAIGLTAALVIYIIFVIVRPKDEVVLRTITINDTYTDENKQALIDGFGKVIDYDPDTQDITFDDDFNLDPSNIDSGIHSKIVVYTTAGTVDVMIADKEMFTWYAKNGFILDLTEVLTEDEIATLGDKVLYETRNEQSEDDYDTDDVQIDPNKKYAFGVCIDDSSIYTKLSDGYAYQKESGTKVSYYIGIIPNSKQKENAVAFIKYLLGQ